MAGSDEARHYLAAARRTREFSLRHLAHYERGFGCLGATFLSYAREVGSRLSDHWYLALQLQADAALVAAGDFSVTCSMAKLVDFMQGLARPDIGFYPRADVDGRNTTTVDTYADDNAVIGLAFLDGRDATADLRQRARLLELARSAGDYLVDGGLWDETFGGGLWWNTNRGLMPEGKPTQTNAAAVQLLLRLYLATGDGRYLSAARQVLAWLEERLYDPVAGLYRLRVRHEDRRSRTGELVEDRYFGYDQGIMIEVHLLLGRLTGEREASLARARDLAERLHAGFWDPELGGYRLERDVDAVYTPYAAWVSQSLLELYEHDHDPRWLERARANIDALNSVLLDPRDNGYYHMSFRCRWLYEPGCEDGQTWSFDPTKLHFSQAWMQRSQALLAERLARAPIAPG